MYACVWYRAKDMSESAPGEGRSSWGSRVARSRPVRLLRARPGPVEPVQVLSALLGLLRGREGRVRDRRLELGGLPAEAQQLDAHASHEQHPKLVPPGEGGGGGGKKRRRGRGGRGGGGLKKHEAPGAK